MFVTSSRQQSRRLAEPARTERRRGGSRRRLDWESLESRALMATLFPGNPINVGVPQQFSGVGGTNTSGGALNALNAFEAAIGGTKNTAAAPQTGGFRTINWDAVKLDGTDFGGGANTTVINANKTVAIPLNRFQVQGAFFGDVYAVSGDGFTDVNPNVTATTFPAFSPNNTFAMFNDNSIDQSFVLPSAAGTNPSLAGTRGFGAIFINNQAANTSSIEYFHGALSLGKFFVPAGAAGQAEFLGVLFNNPIVTNVTLTLGTDTLFNFNGTTATGVGTDPTKLVVTDDFAYAEPVSILDAVPILPGPNGTANAMAKATATVGTSFTGTVATFSYDTPAQASQFTATINWGDGHTSNGKVQASGQGGFDVVGTNTFGAAVAAPIAVHIQDFGIPRANDLDLANVIQVAPAATTTTLTVAPSPVIVNQAVTVTATVMPSAGQTANNGFVEFEDGGVPVGTAPVDSTGKATLTTTKLPIGSHNLTAVFLGSRDFNTSTSTAVTAVVRTDVTNQLAITLGRIQRKSRRFVQHVTIVNHGGTLPGRLVLVLSYLSNGTKLFNASGTTATVPSPGNPFIIIPLGTSGQLAGGASVGVDLIFTARSPRRIHYSPIVLAGLSQP
jgi:hypothetical protein